MALLKLIVLEPHELVVVSAQLQDAAVVVGDMAYTARDRRFVMICNRFNWAAELSQPGLRERRRTALRIEQVTAVRSQGFDVRDRRAVLALLAVTFAPATDPALAPAGVITLTCAGGAALRFDVECLELAVEDLGPSWQAKSLPDHQNNEPK